MFEAGASLTRRRIPDARNEGRRVFLIDTLLARRRW